MERDYDIFEELPDGSPVWRSCVHGLVNARMELEALAKKTRNECFAIHVPTGQVVARLNTGAKPSCAKPLVFQIAYEPRLASERAEILRLHGYEVATVIGNEAAKVVLDLRHPCSLFIVGHAASKETRHAMAAWLKARYRTVPILALNPPEIRELPCADYNAKQNGPETLLPVIAAAVGRHDASEFGQDA
jgi:hypothetical protein